MVATVVILTTIRDTTLRTTLGILRGITIFIGHPCGITLAIIIGDGVSVEEGMALGAGAGGPLGTTTTIPITLGWTDTIRDS